jgi:hypothetical protein
LADETKTEEHGMAAQATSEIGEAATSTEVAAPSGSRRGVLRWIAPVALFVGTTLKSAPAQAADDFTGADPTGRCTPRP